MKRILQAIAQQPWAMSPEYIQAMLDIVAYRMEHGPRSDAEIEARLNGRRERKVAESAGNIAVVAVHGVIHNRMRMVQDISCPGGASAEQIEQQIRTAYSDDSVKTIVLDIDSPGGAAAGTPELASTIRELRDRKDKPIISQVNDTAASAAYWVASAADEIVATPSSDIGSIGVFAVHEEISAMLEEAGVKETIIRAGKYKAEANPYEPLSDEAREYIQQGVDQFYSMFLEGVAAGRGVDKESVRENYGQGRTMLAGDALKAGMIDRIGTMRDTLQRLGVEFDDRPTQNRASARKAVALERKRLELETAREA